MKIEDELASEDAETVILKGDQKMGFRIFFKMSDYKIRHLNMHLNPLDVEKLETARYLIENNLPIKKELLYMVAPDLFIYDLYELEQKEKRSILNKRIMFLNVRFVEFINWYTLKICIIWIIHCAKIR